MDDGYMKRIDPKFPVWLWILIAICAIPWLPIILVFILLDYIQHKKKNSNIKRKRNENHLS